MKKTLSEAEIVENFKTSLENDGKTRATIESYLIDVTHFLKYLKDKQVNFTGDIKRVHFQSFKKYLLDNNYKRSTINKKVNSLQEFNHYLIRQKLTTELVVKNQQDMIKLANGSEMEVEVFSDEEIEKILFFIYEDKISVRDRAIILLLLYTGIRVSEIVNLKLHDIDFLAMKMTVVGKGEKERHIPLKPEVITAIKDYLEKERCNHKQANDSDYLFLSQRSKKMHRDCINRRLKVITKDLGFLVYPHKFRHSFCTNLLKKGTEITTVANLAGHTRVETTARFYINTSKKEKEQAIENL